jgi:hypothetical protein
MTRAATFGVGLTNTKRLDEVVKRAGGLNFLQTGYLVSQFFNFNYYLRRIKLRRKATNDMVETMQPMFFFLNFRHPKFFGQAAESAMTCTLTRFTPRSYFYYYLSSIVYFKYS